MTQPKDIEGLRKAHGEGNLVRFLYERSNTEADADDFDALLSELEAVKGERFFTALLLECARRAERDANYNAVSAGFWQRQHMEVRARLEAAEAALVSLKGGGGSSGGRVQAAPDEGVSGVG